MKRFLMSRKGIALLATIAVAALASGAYAYFTSTGSGTGSVSVGHSSAFSITNQSTSGGDLLPGSGTDTVTWTVHNASSGNQQLSSTTAVVADDGSGNVLDANNADAPVVGCLASWFSVSQTTTGLGSPVDLAGNADFTTGSATVSLTDASANQDPCQGVAPVINISAS
jgi:hypothetical protein